MLISPEELRYDFQGARFDLSRESERKLLGWVFNQFLYGEVTGIQCGHWLYRAPHLGAAAFLAKQAGEELSHVRKILRILSLLGERPAPAHWAIKFLSTGMMGGSWGEHVALEMALGEGLVLGVFYAMRDTIPDPEIQKILAGAAIEEERHVEFGERETMAWLEAHPSTRPVILAQALVQAIVLNKLKRFVTRRVIRQVGADHPVLKQVEAFYEHGLRMFEKRAVRLGLSPVPLRELGRGKKLALLASLPARQLIARLRRVARGPALLTTTYLKDPAVAAEQLRYRPG